MHLDDLIFDTQQHLLLSLYVVLAAAALGIVLSMLTYRNQGLSQALLGVSSVAFTLPSIALLGLMVPVFGLGLGSVFPVLMMYALLPMLRNGIIGLQSIDPNVVDAARGMGMSRLAILLRIELPIAIPVLIAGMRVSAQLTVGLVAIAAYVTAPGLGKYPLNALANLGSVNTFNQALIGTLLIVLLALVLDAAFVIVRRVATPKGIRV